MKDLEQKVKEEGITDLGDSSSTSNSNSTSKNANKTYREKLIRDKRIQEVNLTSLRKKFTLDLQLKKKEIEKYKATKDNCIQ